jgi:3-oxoacyl-[acyl-carrier-protein] synthase II
VNPTLNSVIRGIGVVGGFGSGIGALESASRSAAPERGTVEMESSSGLIEVPALLADTTELAQYISKRALRRVDHYNRMALLACFQAMQDAGVLSRRPRRLGIIVATGYGATRAMWNFKKSLIGETDTIGSPMNFSNSVHNAVAGQIAIALGEKGPNLSVSQFDLSVAQAFLSAQQWLAAGRVDAVLVGAVDEFNNVLGHYWHYLYGRAERQDTNHAVIGEGAAFFLLTGEERSVEGYARIESVDMGNYHKAPPLVDDMVVFAGADGYSGCRSEYSMVIPDSTPVASYSAVYGGLPVGMAFDVAIAALACRDGAVEPGHGIARRVPLRGSRICCLKLGAGKMYGEITIGESHPGRD